MNGPNKTLNTKRAIRVTFVFLIFVAGLCVFPEVWYKSNVTGGAIKMLTLRTNTSDWTFEALPVEKSAERVLVADEIISGVCSNGMGHEVYIFLASRHNPRRNEIGLFTHTPDRCWTEAGWVPEPVMPDHLQINLYGLDLTFERRVFRAGQLRVLVYFGGLADGQPIPFRLDHNISVGVRLITRGTIDRTGTLLRATDLHYWKRIWESFVSRKSITGTAQFIRVSTEIHSEDLTKSDELLKSFMEQCLVLKGTRADVSD